MTKHTENKREISCRTSNTIIQYVRQRGGDAERLLDGIPFDEAYLTDTNNWIPRAVSDKLSRRLRTLFDDDEIMYKVALASERLHSLGFLDYIPRLMRDPSFVIKEAPSLNKYFNRTDEIEVVRFNPGGAVVKYYTKPGYEMTVDDCCYTKGILAVLPKIWRLGNAAIKEETCCIPIHKRGRINGKFYTVDAQNTVYEHDVHATKAGNDTPRIVGQLSQEGTFVLDGIVYGAKECLYHVSWSKVKMLLNRIRYELVDKPKVLQETIEEMQRENELIQEKYEELYEKNRELKSHYVDTINALIRAIDAKDHYTEDHSLNVSSLAEDIARQFGLGPKKRETIRIACKLHDVGKIGIKESILLKPGKLTDQEWEEMKKHPILGYEIIRPLAFLSDVALLIRQDHERWDGKGYPDGLKEDEIDIGARIILVADAYDAMTSGRPYREAMSHEEALAEIKRNAGFQFDPRVVDAFLRLFGDERK